MNIPRDFLEAKRLMSKRWLKRGLEGDVIGRVWTINLSVAVEGALTNVHAVGIGRKVVKGKLSKQLAIRFYVVHKMPKSLLLARTRIPEKVDGLPTDLIETPPAFITWLRRRTKLIQTTSAACSADRRKKQRPVIGGISTGHFAVTAGTIACFCLSARGSDDKSRVYALSNNHVFASVNQASKGDKVYQPGPSDGGKSTDQFATLERFVMIHLGGTKSNRVDAAIAALLPDVTYQPSICTVGRVTGTASATDGMNVSKHGRTTGYTEGKVTDISYDALVGIDNKAVKFEDQIRIERNPSYVSFGEGGDSGSLVLQKGSGKAIGLYFAGPISGSYGVSNPIADVMNELEITLL